MSCDSLNLEKTAGIIFKGEKAYTWPIPNHRMGMVSINLALWSGCGETNPGNFY